MKRFGVTMLLFLLALGATATMQAATVPACVNGASVASYISLSTTGCENGDKIFSNFAYTPSGSDPVAGSIMVGLDNQPGIKQFGLQFQSVGGQWTSGPFTLTYTITIDQAQCAVLYGAGATCSMIAAQGSFQGALAPNSAAMTMALSGAGTIHLDDLATNDNTQQIFFGGVTTTNVSITDSGVSMPAPIDSFGLDVYQTALPEPMTFSLMGIGLLGLGLLRKRLQ